MEEEPEPHTPVHHIDHNKNKPCGCWTGQGKKAVCSICGAAYCFDEVLEFNYWRCYDCGASFPVSAITRSWTAAANAKAPNPSNQGGGD